MKVYYSSIKHHKLKRRVELKERKILEILKNHFGQFHKLNNGTPLNNCLTLSNFTDEILWLIVVYVDTDQ